MKYEFEVIKTVTYVQCVTIEGAQSEDEAFDTVMDVVNPEEWEIDNEDLDVVQI